jgi:signal transduction histidine kinase
MPAWLSDIFERSASFMPHGHCYLWIPALLWLHVISDLLIGIAYIGIAAILWLFVRRVRLQFSPVFVAFGLFIALCGLTHFMAIWTVWNPDYVAAGLLKGATATASVATAIGLYFVRPQAEAVVHSARLSEERRMRLESANAELQALFARVTELDGVKNRFFANLSHELRTPLALILGPVEQMLEDDNLTDAQRRALHGVGANSRSLLKQVNDLLDLARLESGRMELHHVELDAAAWLRRIGSQFEFVAGQRQIGFSVQAPPQLSAQADFDKLERVLVNLLSNAFKFTPAGGTVAVCLQERDGRLQLTVADSGPGIAEAERERVFERFRQVEDGDTRRYGGSGLGLAIVRDFVELHRGRVRIGQAEQGGALVEVELPRQAPEGSAVEHAPGAFDSLALTATLDELAPMPSATPAAADANGNDAQRPAVLVVEDNPEMRAFIASTLAECCHVVAASDGIEGLAQAEALRPALIVTDLMMPRMSGAELVEAIRRKPALDATPILLLTARADDALRVQLLQTGAQDYLTKPFLPQELRARAGNLIAAKRAGDALRGSLDSLSTDLQQLAEQVALRNRQLQTALDAAEVARQQAERASAVKSSFLGMISHELRTPLSTVRMNLQLVQRDRSEALPAALQARLERLSAASQQMAGLIDGLLEYTRVESGRLDARHELVDLAAIAAEIVEQHAGRAPPEVVLSLEPPPSSLPVLHTDPRLLRIVIDNLLGNALKFTAEGAITIRLGSRDDAHMIEVRDSGIGIPEAELPRIFQPFEQLEPVRRKSIPGVGLGLSLVRQILDAIGGRIEVESTQGVGSVFRVWLPSRALDEGSGSLA